MGKVKLDPYLFFQGNCREAMNFYKSIFGGKLTMTTVGETSMDMPDKQKLKDLIMHSMLDAQDVRLMGSDSTKASAQAAKVELSLSGDDGPRLRNFFKKLSAGGKVRFPLEKAEWGDEYGMLTDKYGVDWMVNISAKKG